MVENLVNQSVEVAASIATSDGLLRVEFYRVADRYAHRIVHQQAPGVLQSVEGDADDVWPPSPPLQQLSLEEHSGSAIALLLGMAGKSHWSMSVEAKEQQLLFDVACRLSGEHPRLSSTYQASNSDKACWTIQPEETGASQAKVTANGANQVIAPTAPPAGTQRWRYAITR